MAPCWRLTILATLLLGGCAYHARDRVDRSVRSLTCQPYDRQPPEAAIASVAVPSMASASVVRFPPVAPGTAPLRPMADVQTVAYLEPPSKFGSPDPPGGEPRLLPDQHLDLTIPTEIPGAETRPIELSEEPSAKQREIERLYPDLTPLATEPIPLPGPNGRPYTLADLQQIAATNSPELRQAASDVESARGEMIRANAYPNPTVSYQFNPSNDGSTPGADGVGIAQTIKTGGKLGLQKAAAAMALRNAELALRRARSDLATEVRNAYFAVIVAKETVRVQKALAHFTEEVYRLQSQMLAGGFAAPYEPAALRAQAFSARLAYKQAIQSYIYAWKQLVAVINVRQLPLSEVAGRVDSFIPYYDYDAILAYILRNHTDILTARNGIEEARYNLKLAQVAPVPDVNVNMAVLQDYSVAPKQATPMLTLGVPLAIWNRNQGAIIAAEGAMVRAAEEPHRVEQNLTNTLAGAYANYRNNLEALEYYRRHILPDQVRAYRGAHERRQIDPSASFGELVVAQQTLASNVASYLQTLGQLWLSVTSVADLIQTDDLFQFARPEAVPPLPDLNALAALPCCHPSASRVGVGSNVAVGRGPRASVPEPISVPDPVHLPAPHNPFAPPGGQRD